MRIMIGVGLALVTGMLFSLWLWDQASDRADQLAERLTQVTQERDEQRRQAQAWGDRFAALDETLGMLQTDMNNNRQQLDKALLALGQITQQEGDTDETMECLDRAVPRQLDGGLRHGNSTDRD